MLRRMVQTGLFAGFLTALVYSLVQAVTVTPLIFDAEFYEAQAGDPSHGSVHVHEGGSEHIHDAEPATAPWEPEDGIERYGFTFLANVVTALGFAFLLVAAIAVRGRTVLLVTGENDLIVLPAEAEALYAHASEPKKLSVIEGAGHYDLYTGEAFDKVMSETVAWFGEHLGQA